MNVKEVFAQLLRYFPEDDNAKLYKTISEYSLACLETGDFAEAEKYADVTINRDSDKSHIISARKIKLYVKLSCRNDEQFIHAEKFNRDMPEYEELIAVCSEDRVKLNKILNLVKRNEETVAEDRRIREEEDRRRQEKEEMTRKEAEMRQREEERKRAQEVKERRKELRVSFRVMFFFIIVPIVLNITGFAFLGSGMEGSLKHLLAGLCFTAAFVLSLLMFMKEKKINESDEKEKKFSELSGKGWISFLSLLVSAIALIVLFFISYL